LPLNDPPLENAKRSGKKYQFDFGFWILDFFSKAWRHLSSCFDIEAGSKKHRRALRDGKSEIQNLKSKINSGRRLSAG
jgi:hypothetical protein